MTFDNARTWNFWTRLVVVLLAAFSFAGVAHAEFMLGSAKAPVTLIEYGSLTCDYCVRFHREVLPLIRSRHINSGRVRFIYRDYPTSDEALRGAVAARCAGSSRYFEMLDALYSTAGRWSRAENIDSALIQRAASLGLDVPAFRTCLGDSRHVRSIEHEQRLAAKEHGVLGTPTFLINGSVVPGIRNIDQMDALIEKALSAKRPRR